MPVLPETDYAYSLPTLRRVRQIFEKDALFDADGTLRRDLQKKMITNPIHMGDQVVVTVRSREIKSLPLIVELLWRI